MDMATVCLPGGGFPSPVVCAVVVVRVCHWHQDSAAPTPAEHTTQLGWYQRYQLEFNLFDRQIHVVGEIINNMK